MTAGDILSSFAWIGTEPRGVTHDGINLWINDRDVNKIFELNESGSVQSSWAVPGTERPSGMGHDGTNLWWSNGLGGTPRILESSETGSTISSFVSPDTSIQGVTHDGTNLWMVEDSVAKIFETNETGTIQSSFSTPDTEESGLTWDGTNLWHANRGAVDKIFELTTTGTILSSFATPGSDAWGLGYDGNNLWNADQTADKVFEVEVLGAGVTFIPKVIMIT